MDENSKTVSEIESLNKTTSQILLERKSLTIKLGIDPTIGELHLGHLVALHKLKEFQSRGHSVILVLGDFTASVGDPSGRDKTRPVLSRKDTEKNANSIEQQLRKIFSPNNLAIVRNSVWFDTMSAQQLVTLCSSVTVQSMLRRNDFKQRLQSQNEIRLSETLYPVLQGWDSVMVGADIELGGNDQLFNIMIGRALQAANGQRPQEVLLLPLLPGMDGSKKMSKSANNCILLNDVPNEIFGKVMSISDQTMWTWLTILFNCKDDHIVALKKRPMLSKLDLASSIVTLCHSKELADEAKKRFIEVFSKRNQPELAVELSLAGKELTSLELVRLSKFTDSNTKARALIEQGGLQIDKKKVIDPREVLKLSPNSIVKMGKRHFFKIVDQNPEQSMS